MSDVEELLYVISHDLKAPLRKVGGFATLLERRLAHELAPEDAELLAYVAEGAQQLDHMLDELLIYSRVGRREEPWVSVSLEQVVQEQAKEMVWPEAPITWDALPVLHGEPSQIALVVHHLLDNAVRYGRGPVHVYEDAGRICVQDAGEGIQDWDRAVGLFRRMDAAAGPLIVGMGLPIVARIVERHGGSLGCSREPSVVWFKWPAATGGK